MKRNYKKNIFTIILTVFMLLLNLSDSGGLFLLTNNKLKADGDPEIVLDFRWLNPAPTANHSSAWSEGDAKLTVTPANNTATTVTAMMIVELPKGTIENPMVAAPGEIEIRIPMYLFDSRSGDKIVNGTLANSRAQLELTATPPYHASGYYYVVDEVNQEYVIKNWAPVDGGKTSIISINYTYIPTSVANGYTNEIGVSLTFNHNNEPTRTKTSNKLKIQTNSFVRQPSQFANNIYGNKQEYWSASWAPAGWGDPTTWDQPGHPAIAAGVAAFDPADYYYVIYDIRLGGTANNSSTQPYYVTYDINLGSTGGGSIVGVSGATSSVVSTAVVYPFVGQTTAQMTAASLNPLITPSSTSATSFYLHRFVLVKYPRDQIDEGQTNFTVSYLMEGIDEPGNNETWATWTAATNPIGATAATRKYRHFGTVTRSYTYVPVGFRYTVGIFGISKAYVGSANSTTRTIFSAINRIEEDEDVELVRSAADLFSYTITGVAQGWILTRDETLVFLPPGVRLFSSADWDGIAAGDKLTLTNPAGNVAVKANGVDPVNGNHYWAIFNSSSGTLLGYVRQAGATLAANVNINTNLIAISRIRTGENESYYYQKKYSIELVDDMVFIDNIRLKPEDYGIHSLYISTFEEQVHAVNVDTGDIYGVPATDYQNYAPVELWYKTVEKAQSEGWIKAGEIIRTNATTLIYVPTSASSPQLVNPALPISANNQLILPNDTFEIKMLHENNRYQVTLIANIKIRLYPTENVKKLLENKTTATLNNVNTFVVRDSTGAIRNYVAHGRMYSDVDSNGTQASTNTVAEPMKRSIMEHDHELYGSAYQNYNPASITNPTYVTTDRAVQHFTSIVTLNKIVSRTTLTKTAPVATNNGATNLATSRQTIEMYEQCQYDPDAIEGATITDKMNKLAEAGIFQQQKTGTFYDLLPAETMATNITVVTYNTSTLTNYRRPCTFETYTIANWQGSGRTMLVVKVKAPTAPVATYYPTPNFQTVVSVGYNTAYSGFVLSYDLVSTYANLYDQAYGTTWEPTNLVAYRSDEGRLGNGGPVTQPLYNYFKSLESEPGIPDDTGRNTVYAGVTVRFNLPLTTSFGIDKNVKSQADSIFGLTTMTVPGGIYTYQLRYQHGPIGMTQDLKMYDILETEGDWQGKLLGIDTSFAEAKGIVPLIYYSTVTGLQPLIDQSGKQVVGPDGDLTNTAIWSTAAPADLTQVTAIAIDLSQRSDNVDGGKYIFRSNDSVYCLLLMSAPTQNYQHLIDNNLKAINRLAYSITETSIAGTQLDIARYSGQVSVGLRNLDFSVAKASNPASGTSANPTVVNRDSIIEYEIIVNNLDATPVRDVKVIDMIPEGLTILDSGANRIKYYFGSDPATASNVAGSSRITMQQNGQELTFVVDSINARQTLRFLVPVRVNTTNNDGVVFVNQAQVSEVNGVSYNYLTNLTYHKTLPKVTINGNKTIVGIDDNTKTFTFNLQQVTAIGSSELTGTISGTATITGAGNFSIDLLFATTGEYYFMLSEDQTGHRVGNWKYAQNKYWFKVTVVDDNSVLKATVSETSGSSNFINTYELPSYDVALKMWVAEVERGGSVIRGPYSDPGTTTPSVAVKPGDTVTFAITAYNQTEYATWVSKLINYLPSGYSFDENDPYNDDWTLIDGKLYYQGNPIFLAGNDDYEIDQTYGAGSTATIYLTLRVVDNSDLRNWAEIKELKDDDQGSPGNVVADRDSANTPVGDNKSPDNSRNGNIIDEKFNEGGSKDDLAFADTEYEIVSGSAIIRLRKAITGVPTANNGFIFDLVEVDDLSGTAYSGSGTAISKQVINTATITAGTPVVLTFPTITEVDSSKTWYFKITEASTSIPPGWTYSGASYVIAVNVDVYGDTTVTYPSEYSAANPPLFVNNYRDNTRNVNWSFSGIKQTEGKALAANQFNFAVMQDNVMIATGTNNASGLITFSAISFTEAGEYRYQVIETSVSGAGWTCDTTEYEINVVVVENIDGSFTITPELLNGEVVFVNVYDTNYRPQTGDSSNLTAIWLLLFASIMIVITLIFLGEQRKRLTSLS